MLCHMWGSNELAFTDSKGVGGPPLSKDLGEERAEPELWSKTGGCGGGEAGLRLGMKERPQEDPLGQRGDPWEGKS